MAYQKIDKDFVLSDSTVNVYGFRLLTSGCVMDEVLKNPIGYYQHNKDADGVLLRWEDVRLSGDQILGKPVINMEHPRAERTVTEINDGFLNAASVGSIVLVDYHFEDNLSDAENPILVGDKWYYKECSLVESPGNRNAFKTALFDINDNEINLSDLTDTYFLKSKSNTMHKIELAITPELISILNLSDAATPTQVGAAIKDLSDRVVNSEKALKDLQDSSTKKEVTDLLDNALNVSKKITAALHATLLKQYADKPKDLKDLLDNMPGFVSISSKLNQREKNGVWPDKVKDLMDMGYDKLMETGKMKNLKDLSDEAYVVLYTEKYGYGPNEKPDIKK